MGRRKKEVRFAGGRTWPGPCGGVKVEVDTAIAKQIALYGNEGDYINAQKQRNEARPALPTTAPHPGTLRWYWNGYKLSDHWLGDLSVGQAGLSDATPLPRTGLIAALLPENGEKPVPVLTLT